MENCSIVPFKFVLVIKCLGGRYGIKYPKAFLKIFKNFQNHLSDLSRKWPESNLWLLVNNTKPTNIL